MDKIKLIWMISRHDSSVWIWSKPDWKHRKLKAYWMGCMAYCVTQCGEMHKCITSSSVLVSNHLNPSLTTKQRAEGAVCRDGGELGDQVSSTTPARDPTLQAYCLYWQTRCVSIIILFIKFLYKLCK